MGQATYLAETALLSGFPILRTEDLSEARAVVGQAFCDHRLDTGRSARLRVCHDHVSGGDVSLNELGYGAEVRIDPGQLQHFYLLQFPLAGVARIEHRGETIEADTETATILNPDRDARMVWGEGCRKLLLQVDRGHLEDVAEDLIGSSLPGPIRFDPRVDLTQSDGRRLFRHVAAAAHAATRGELWRDPAGLNEAWIERELAVVLMESQPSNVSHMLWRASRAPTSREMRRALDFLHTNISEPLRVEDIAREAGVNIRSLQIGFKAAFGVSPMRYLKDVRLDAARYLLSRRQNRGCVTDVAYSVGFSHLGRFSQDYRARFGSNPSAR